jgi:hypothetical protein
MKITEMLISAIVKKGILYEARNADIQVDVPMTGEDGKQNNIKITFKAEHMTLKIEKGD